ncbi:ribonuclease H-like domain-containing protein [Nemania sp. FL0916]|nr:ribonuclease H-like domain-containing protein [Nemania sp. FL0916]
MPASHERQHELIEKCGPGSISRLADHHLAGNDGTTCNLFPSIEYMVDEASCGTSNLEVEGFRGFRHVRCPWAAPNPCRCGRHDLHIDSLIVAVDGACPGNGTPRATKSAYGIFYGEDAEDNMSISIWDEPGYSHTSQRAELWAAIGAIVLSEKFFRRGGQWDCTGCPTPCVVTHFIIKSDSAYLVNGMTSHIKKWRQNDWRTAKGTEVKNRDLWTRLDELTRDSLKTGVAIDFWLVPREENQDADYLANLGLEKC